MQRTPNGSHPVIKAGPVGLRAQQTGLAQATALLKQRWAARASTTQLMQERPATKKDARTVKLTHGTPAAYGAETLRMCPGGGVRGNKFTTINILRMGDATLTPETGCRLATKATLRRLLNSALNANTTQGNYNSTHLRKG